MTESLRHILTTTEQLIFEKGCKETTLQDIIKNSGLSKGAIYHYVRSKDELFGLILQVKMEEINEKFHQAKDKQHAELEAPLSAIASNFTYLMDEKDVTNQIFIYLLGRKDNPIISKKLSEVHEHTNELSVSWIEAGQKAGVIPDSLHVEKTVSMFITFAYGLRVMSMMNKKETTITMEDYYDFMSNMLHQS